MGKAFTTLEVVIWMILILAFAATVLFAVVPKFEKTPGLVEKIIPEKCRTTGLTRDQYEARIYDALATVPPRTKEALELNTEMRACFPEAKMAEELTSFLRKSVEDKIRAKAGTPTPKEYETILNLYDDSRTAVPKNEWSADILVQFTRALLEKGIKTRPAEVVHKQAFELADILERKERGTKSAEEAEALSVLAQTSLLATGEEGTEYYDELNKRFEKIKTPEAQYFKAVTSTKVTFSFGEEEIQELQKAKKSNDSYIRQGAMFYLGQAYLQAKKYKKSAEEYELLFGQAAESVFFEQALKNYSLIPNLHRTKFKDCKINQEVIGTPCICKTGEFPDTKVYLLPELVNGIKHNYCCKDKINNAPCGFDCESPEARFCNYYKTRQDCEKDPCKIAKKHYPDLYKRGRRCKWKPGPSANIPAACIMETA